MGTRGLLLAAPRYQYHLQLKLLITVKVLFSANLHEPLLDAMLLLMVDGQPFEEWGVK